MPHYRKKPVEIEAIQFTGIVDTGFMGLMGPAFSGEMPDWLVQAQRPQGYAIGRGEWTYDPKLLGGVLQIGTLEGVHTASPNDFIIKGVNGEIYPCKPDIFKKTYVEVVTETELLDILSWDTDPEEEGLLPDRIETHDGTWVRDDAPDTWYFEWSVE